ncbi:hypothetical protein AVEN_266813-1 [Araneus ventricosus]|uniref:Uncharacterized protein n=1 Tax=Araneus ventricosus TaxID=182803 RepID=A0A4Y2HCY9_ARAVE|nr:hypothetical protein AVEN_266813-1 [Araneus ventricosus]
MHDNLFYPPHIRNFIRKLYNYFASEESKTLSLHKIPQKFPLTTIRWIDIRKNIEALLSRLKLFSTISSPEFSSVAWSSPLCYRHVWQSPDRKNDNSILRLSSKNVPESLPDSHFLRAVY